MIFETERLYLRPFTQDDLDTVLRISSDPETTRYLYFWGRIGTTPESDAKRFLDYATSTAWEYCLLKKDTGEKIGDGSVERLDEHTADSGVVPMRPQKYRYFVVSESEEIASTTSRSSQVKGRSSSRSVSKVMFRSCVKNAVPSRRTERRFCVSVTGRFPRPRDER